MMASYRNHPVGDHESVVGADTQFIDVRQPSEFSKGTLAGAANVPLDRLARRIDQLDPHRRTVLLCRSGGRSTQAAEMLVKAGFSDVVNLEGGLLAHFGKDMS